MGRHGRAVIASEGVLLLLSSLMSFPRFQLADFYYHALDRLCSAIIESKHSRCGRRTVSDDDFIVELKKAMTLLHAKYLAL